MLNLTFTVEKLTQGQPVAIRVLAAAPGKGAADVEEVPEAQITSSSTPPPTPFIDLHLVARRVYELMRQDLVVTRDRCGRR